MRHRMPWMLLFGLGAGLLLVRGVARGRRKGAGGPGAGQGAHRERLPRDPEVVRGSISPDASGLDKPLASAVPDTVPGRSFRAVSPPRHIPSPLPPRFEPVVADAPELRDASAEPPAVEPAAGSAEPVPPIVRKRG